MSHARLLRQSKFLQTHKVGNVGIIAHFVFSYISRFFSVFVPIDVSKCKIRNQGIYNDKTSFFPLDELILNGRAKTKLAI